MGLIAKADFESGKYQLHTGMYDDDQITEYILKYENKYMISLLGAELFELFWADINSGLTGIPVSPKYLKIYNPMHVDEGSFIIYSEGMKEMLKGFIYYEYIKDKSNQMTTVGLVKPIGENSQPISTLYSMSFNRYNEAVFNYKAIQEYIIQNKGDYDTFNGRRKFLMSWI